MHRLVAEYGVVHGPVRSAARLVTIALVTGSATVGLMLALRGVVAGTPPVRPFPPVARVEFPQPMCGGCYMGFSPSGFPAAAVTQPAADRSAKPDESLQTGAVTACGIERE